MNEFEHQWIRPEKVSHHNLGNLNLIKYLSFLMKMTNSSMHFANGHISDSIIS